MVMVITFITILVLLTFGFAVVMYGMLEDMEQRLYQLEQEILSLKRTLYNWEDRINGNIRF
jgi:hypothetical protein